MCKFISTEFPEATVTCRHLPDPSVIPGGFQPLPPYFAFVVKLKFPVKEVSVGFSSGPWLRDAPSFESIRRLMEKHQWKQRVEEATDGGRTSLKGLRGRTGEMRRRPRQVRDRISRPYAVFRPRPRASRPRPAERTLPTKCRTRRIDNPKPREASDALKSACRAKLLGPQCRNRVNFGSPPSRYVAGNERDHEQNCTDQRKRYRIGWAHTDDETCNQ